MSNPNQLPTTTPEDVTDVPQTDIAELGDTFGHGPAFDAELAAQQAADAEQSEEGHESGYNTKSGRFLNRLAGKIEGFVSKIDGLRDKIEEHGGAAEYAKVVRKNAGRSIMLKAREYAGNASSLATLSADKIRAGIDYMDEKSHEGGQLKSKIENSETVAKIKDGAAKASARRELRRTAKADMKAEIAAAKQKRAEIVGAEKAAKKAVRVENTRNARENAVGLNFASDVSEAEDEAYAIKEQIDNREGVYENGLDAYHEMIAEADEDNEAFDEARELEEKEAAKAEARAAVEAAHNAKIDKVIDKSLPKVERANERAEAIKAAADQRVVDAQAKVNSRVSTLEARKQAELDAIDAGKKPSRLRKFFGRFSRKNRSASK